MKIIIKETAAQASAAVMEILLQQISSRPDSVLGLPTGGTPLAVYARLREEFEKGRGSYGLTTTFNLDEYMGLSSDDPASYARYMRENLFEHVDIDTGRTNIPNGWAFDAEAEAKRYEALIASSGGIDLMLLGLGRNAHIGFNEPGSAHDSRTRRVALTESTLAANAAYFAPGVTQPTHAITMGIGTILECRRIVVLATGFEKAQAVASSVSGVASEAVPGSALSHHPNTTIVLDKAAARDLGIAQPMELRA
ncbi:glucosamine-6-phosphate deaminase [Rhizobium tumorigenes]|uniref:glucosamine-6-phosphate deaminase n=1 Tax=Rhizobium tumorigenes TaxID=2041385 RepID=UPI00241C6897|nr:glucosamine-6-phosphate deaminase [Rhizobium tumorigenes]WFR99565.1 glucosamine-6-phosphate deaminase [Rhizobium tumorigenes]